MSLLDLIVTVFSRQVRNCHDIFRAMSWNLNNIFKSWTGVPVLILLVLAAVWVFTNGLSGYKNWQVRRAYEKLIEPHYKDTYGGGTPEETYDMFIDALKKDDVELASKYFVIDSQKNWLEALNKYKTSGYLPNFIEELENTKSKWFKIETRDLDMVAFRYKSPIGKDTETEFEGQKITIPAGNYTNETVFNRYSSGVWKIATL